MPDIIIQPLNIADREWVSEFMLVHWGSNKVVSRRVVYYPQDLPGFVAMYDGEKVGLSRQSRTLLYNLDAKGYGLLPQMTT